MNLELDKFRTARGQFQIDLQEISVTETDLTEVRAFVAEPSVRETIEARKIESFEYREKISNIKRRIGIVSLAIVVISILTYVLTPSKQTSFRALDYVGYEALAIEEDADGRVDLPSDDIIEIERYLSQDPSLGFKPRIMRPKNWHPEGASVIDYDGNKVSVAYYSNPQINEKIFHFQTQGTLSQLPRGPLGKVGKITYQTFTQDRVNIIVWQESDQVLSMLVGHRGAEELAKIADESI